MLWGEIKVCKGLLRGTKFLLCGRCLNYFYPYHINLTVTFLRKTDLKNTSKAPAVDLLRSNTLRSTKPTGYFNSGLTVTARTPGLFIAQVGLTHSEHRICAYCQFVSVSVTIETLGACRFLLILMTLFP